MSLVSNIVWRLPLGGEFSAGKNGDCAEIAYQMGRAALQPWHSTAPPELLRLVNEALAAGETDCPGGCMTDAQFAWLCQRERCLYTQMSFDENTLQGWLAGGFPVVCGFRNGQALPGNEPGVQGHAVCFLEHEPGGGYTLYNGDSANGRAGKLDTGVSSAAIHAAVPTTLTMLRGTSMLQITDVSEWFEQVSPTDWRCKQTGFHIVLGLLEDYRSMPSLGLAGMTEAGLPLEAEHGVTGKPGVALQRFERLQRAWDPSRIYGAPPGVVGPCYNTFSPVTEAPAPPPVDTAGIVADANAIKAAADDIIHKASG